MHYLTDPGSLYIFRLATITLLAEFLDKPDHLFMYHQLCPRVLACEKRGQPKGVQQKF